MALEPHRLDPEPGVEGDGHPEVESETETPSVKDRPQDLNEMVGQETLVRQLKMVCVGSKLRGTPMPHILISGPAGHGKTTLAGIIANQLGAKLVTTTGMVVRKPQDLVGLLVKMDGPTCLFIDEVHALSKPVQETLYTVLEDARIDIIAGSGTESESMSHDLPELVVVGATTRPGLLTIPFRDRFGYQGVMDPYTEEELAIIAGRAWDRVGVSYAAGEAEELAKRAKGVPRRVLHLVERVLDYMAVINAKEVVSGTVSDALSIFGIDADGLDEVDFRILCALTGPFAGKTVGLDALAQALDLDAHTLTEQYEPYLTRRHLIIRAKSGRMASPEAYQLVKQRQVAA